MKDETREKANELIEQLDADDEIEVTGFDIKEYIRGDPTTDDASVTGAEIDLTCYITFDEDADDDNPYRIQ